MTSEQLALGGSLVEATLFQAVNEGQGIERPFRCPNPEHDDRHASASVNVLKKVWYCYACGAKGKVDSKAVPTKDELLAMMEPEESGKVYPESWLNWFGYGYYWADRFPMWVCRMFSFGQDPMSGDPTFPVYTPEGRLAGVGQRGDSSYARYLYPKGWAASRSLFGMRQAHNVDLAVLVLIEGAADTAAIWEVGAPGFGCYGAGLHWPQREFIARINPKLVLLGFDADAAGEKARIRTEESLEEICETQSIDWLLGGAKDPADMSPEARATAITKAVSDSSYGRRSAVLSSWAKAAAVYTKRYDKDT